MINTQQLRQEQTEKAQQIILTDQFMAPTYIAGADVGFEIAVRSLVPLLLLCIIPPLKLLNIK